MSLPEYRRDLKFFARNLRQHGTMAEALLWQKLRRRQLMGYRFLRQRPIGSFIVDFYCPRLRMVIEINGASHEWKDGGPRAKYLQSLGMRVLNFTELEVRKDLGNVLDGIASAIREMVDGERGGAENPPPR